MSDKGGEEARIDARISEVESAIEKLQNEKAELLRARVAIRSGKPQSVTPAPAVNPATTNKALEATLNSMEWSSFKKREGEWAFLRTREGGLVDALQSETDFVNTLRKGKEVVVGKYRYKVSEDKFLNRYFQA